MARVLSFMKPNTVAADVINTVWTAVVSGGPDRHGEPQQCMGLFCVFPVLQHPRRLPIWQGDSSDHFCIQKNKSGTMGCFHAHLMLKEE